MRIKENELSFILQVFSSHLNSTTSKLYLFGSRVDDSKKGGDIDLLVVTSPEHLEFIRDLKSRIAYEIQGLISEQKIDITIVTPKDLNSDEFLISIMPAAVLLKAWPA